jgi:hypothetical protein
MQIFVKLLGGKIITLQVESSDIIEDIKARIHEKGGSHPCLQRLILPCGVKLGPQHLGHRLCDYGIQEDDTLHCVLYLTGPGYAVRFPDGSTVSFLPGNVWRSGTALPTIGDLKDKISKGVSFYLCEPCELHAKRFEAVPVALQRLSYKGRVCKDTEQIEEAYPEMLTMPDPSGETFFDLEILLGSAV